jgi:hypothetical protein
MCVVDMGLAPHGLEQDVMRDHTAGMLRQHLQASGTLAFTVSGPLTGEGKSLRYPAAAREKIERRDTLLTAGAALKRRLADAKGALDRALPGRGAD